MTDFVFARMAPVQYRDAVKRVTAYCASDSSGWATYDLPGIAARSSGFFDTVTPWSILIANALSARVNQKQVAEFTRSVREEFARRLSCVPVGRGLGELDAKQLSAVVDLACFGFKGAWAPTITKVAALYRPHAVPVLDSQVAAACGFARSAFRSGRQRLAYVEQAITLLSEWHRRSDARGLLESLRSDIRKRIPEIDQVSDVRLIDIVIWTSQDDIYSRRSQKKKRWDEMSISKPAAGRLSAEGVRVGGNEGTEKPTNDFLPRSKREPL